MIEHDVNHTQTGVHRYFTFGTGSLLRGHCVSLMAPTEDAARRAMSSMFKDWAAVYTQSQFQPIAAKYGYKLLLALAIDEGDTE